MPSWNASKPTPTETPDGARPRVPPAAERRQLNERRMPPTIPIRSHRRLPARGTNIKCRASGQPAVLGAARRRSRAGSPIASAVRSPCQTADAVRRLFETRDPLLGAAGARPAGLLVLTRPDLAQLDHDARWPTAGRSRDSPADPGPPPIVPRRIVAIILVPLEVPDEVLRHHEQERRVVDRAGHRPQGRLGDGGGGHRLSAHLRRGATGDRRRHRSRSHDAGAGQEDRSGHDVRGAGDVRHPPSPSWRAPR